jgi:hypothetical protein
MASVSVMKLPLMIPDVLLSSMADYFSAKISENALSRSK